MKGYWIGQRFIGEASGPHEVFRLQCENCGDVQEADSVNLGADDDGVDLERPTCPKCGGTVQVFLKQTSDILVDLRAPTSPEGSK